MELTVRQEIGMMRAQLETTKFQIIQWLFGVVTGAGALGLGTSLQMVDTNNSLYPFAHLKYRSIYYRLESNLFMQ